MISLQESNWSLEENKEFVDTYVNWVELKIKKHIYKNAIGHSTLPRENTIEEMNNRIASLTYEEHLKFDGEIKNIISWLNFLFKNIPSCKPGEIRELLLLTADELKLVRSEINRDIVQNVFFQKSFNFFEKIYSELIGESKFLNDEKFNTMFVKKLNINVCPFCNRNYINNRKKENNVFKSSAQLDHFYNKSSYPIFSLCLNNLIPSCAACNHIKHDTNFSISPYTMKDGEIMFDLDLYSSKYFTIRGINSQLEEQVNILGLNTAYEPHREDVQDIIVRKQIYTNRKIEEIENILDISLYNRTWKDLVFGKVYSSEEDKKYALSKLRREIINQLL